METLVGATCSRGERSAVVPSSRNGTPMPAPTSNTREDEVADVWQSVPLPHAAAEVITKWMLRAGM